MTANEIRRKAPITAAFIGTVKEIFGEVSLQRAKEGDVVIGKTHEVQYATCFFGGSGKPISEYLK